MTRIRLPYRFNPAPILVMLLCAWGVSSYGQDLFEQYEATAKEAEMTKEETATAERESIF